MKNLLFIFMLNTCIISYAAETALIELDAVQQSLQYVILRQYPPHSDDTLSKYYIWKKTDTGTWKGVLNYECLLNDPTLQVEH